MHVIQIIPHKDGVKLRSPVSGISQIYSKEEFNRYLRDKRNQQLIVFEVVSEDDLLPPTGIPIQYSPPTKSPTTFDVEYV